jgi:mannan endo-1,4-beta-mannosidase
VVHLMRRRVLPPSHTAAACSADGRAGAAVRSRPRRMLLHGIVPCALLLTSVLGVSAKAEGFVTRHGTQFMLNGQPFYVTGVNNHYLAWGSEVEVDRVLDAAVAMGANVVRTILGPAIGTPDGDGPKTIWKFHDNETNSYELNTHGMYLLYWDPATRTMGINGGPNGIAKIDYLIAAAAKRHLRLLLTLLDYWRFIGDMPQMDAWYGSTNQTTFFFSDPRTIADYKTWARYLIHHINPLTGTMYRDDPTIFGWELMNESHARSRLQRPWTEMMSAYIKSLDPHHLVSSGEDYLTMDEFGIPSIDFVTWHGYPKYYGVTPDALEALIQRDCGFAAIYQKPVLLEEFGYAGNNRDPSQAQAYQMWLKTMADDADCAGWLVWSLVAQQDSGFYPDDTGGWFDVHDDGGATWTVLSQAAHQGRAYANSAAGLKPQ